MRRSGRLLFQSEADFELAVRLASGDEVVALPGVAPRWDAARAVQELSKQHPLAAGLTYKLICGDRAFEGNLRLQDLFPKCGVPGSEERRRELQALIVESDNAEEERAMALIDAATQLRESDVVSLLAAGADASYVHEYQVQRGFVTDSFSTTALVSALAAAGLQGHQHYGTAKESPKLHSNTLPIVTALIRARADANVQAQLSKSDGNVTAMELAISKVPLLRLLLDHGGDANARKVSSQTSKRSAGTYTSRLLHIAVRRRDVCAARALLDARASIEAQSEKQENPFSIQYGSLKERVQETALHIAAGLGDVAMLALLLQRGADVDAPRVDLDVDEVPSAKTNSEVALRAVEETALHVALRRGHAEAAAALVLAGADVERPRCRGETCVFGRAPQGRLDEEASPKSLCELAAAGDASVSIEPLLLALKARELYEARSLVPSEHQAVLLAAAELREAVDV